jgi:hypothetical protein
VIWLQPEREAHPSSCRVPLKAQPSANVPTGSTINCEQKQQEHHKINMASMEAKLFNIINQVSSLDTKVFVRIKGNSNVGSSPRLWRESAGTGQEEVTQQANIDSPNVPAGEWQLELSELKMRGNIPNILPLGIQYPRRRRVLLPLVPFVSLKIEPFKGGVEICLEAADADEFASMMLADQKWPLSEQNNTYKLRTRLSRLSFDLFGDEDADSDVSVKLQSVILSGSLLPLFYISQKYVASYWVERVPLDWFPSSDHPAAIAQGLCNANDSSSQEDEKRKFKIVERKFTKVLVSFPLKIFTFLHFRYSPQIKKLIAANLLGAEHGASSVILIENFGASACA